MIREATIDDVPVIAALAQENHATSSLDLPPINAAKFLGWIKQANKVFISNKGDGVIALKVVPFEWSDFNYVTNMLFYVKKDSRKSLVAVRLLNEAKKYAETLNLPLIIGIMSGEDVELKGEFLKRQNGKFLGGAYMMEN